MFFFQINSMLDISIPNYILIFLELENKYKNTNRKPVIILINYT